MKKLSFILGLIAGLLMAITGVLTAMKITPEITAAGLEVGLGIWRIFAGILVVIFVFISRKSFELNWVIVALGLFEILVFFVEKDYTFLVIAPFIAILSGILGLIKK